ncbi:hypothetical protein PU629_07915 [Pullulanibacillus sp. KACC 23026]|uniref:hypothetical protein n=1 Tax=Pullulanibacillus sp. KACC 23026 TaxID=3028315 RepID=UPI0023B167D1|nr:hypothetical protein [Pullulanibacillus sp. KACC 23026]WEG14273.1 hypothetical protein PU629_07915 [Pullulanibacillus sp. KACC 23026]
MRRTASPFILIALLLMVVYRNRFRLLVIAVLTLVVKRQLERTDENGVKITDRFDGLSWVTDRFFRK